MNNFSPQSWLTKITLLLVSTLTVMSGATIAPSLPAMRDHFLEVPQVELWVRLVLTMPALFIVIGSPVAGIIVDKFGRKPLLIAAAFVYGFGGSSGFILDNLYYILIGRAILGLAVAGIMVSAITLIADYYIGQARANFMGLQAGFMSLGGVIFLSGGGYVADFNWRLPFLIYLFSWVLIPLLIFCLSEPNIQKNSDSLDIEKSTLSMPFNLLILTYSLLLLSQIAFYLIPVQLPFYLQNLFNAQAKHSGLAIAFSTIFSATSSINYGKVKQRFNYVHIFVIVFILMGAGFTIIGLGKDYLSIGLGLALLGSGLGLLIPNTTVLISGQVPNLLRGRALGGVTTFTFLGQFLSPLVTYPLNQLVGLAMTYVLTGLTLFLVGLIIWYKKRLISKYVEISSY